FQLSSLRTISGYRAASFGRLRRFHACCRWRKGQTQAQFDCCSQRPSRRPHMQVLQIILVLSAFISGVAMPLFPNPAIREGSQKAVWVFASAIGTYILFLAICTVLPNYLIVLPASLAALGAGYVCGAFAKQESGAVRKPAPRVPGVKPVHNL